MTKREAAIVSAYTGYMVGEFSDMQEYAQKLMGRPIFTHEFANRQVVDDLREKSKRDFVSLSKSLT